MSQPVVRRVIVLGDDEHGKSSLIRCLRTASVAVATESDLTLLPAQAAADVPASLPAPAPMIEWIEASPKPTAAPASSGDVPDVALLVIDAVVGMRPETVAHLAAAERLGCRRLVVAINKMDLVEERQSRYLELAGDLRRELDGRAIGSVTIVPVSARTGNGVTAHTRQLAWACDGALLPALAAGDE
jgi:translation elongation factor EF-1alpha